MTAAAVLILVNCGDRAEAGQIADALLARGQAAAAQIVGPAESRFIWQGEVQVREEWLLLVKTGAARAASAEATVRELHGYELPGVVRLDIDAVAPEYLRWLTGGP